MIGAVFRFFRTILPALSLAVRLAAAQDSARVEVIFLDVGQGDAVVIRGPGPKVALIDAGPRGSRVADALAELGVDTVHLAVASHPHADHIGGMAEVLGRFPVKAYLDNGIPHTTSTYRALLDVVTRLGQRDSVFYRRAEARTFILGDMRLRVLPPPEFGAGLNDRSVGILLEFGEFRAIFPGDAERGGLAHFANLGLPQVTVLKASHHGSGNGVSAEWLEAVRPRVVVISVGARNGYGHPHREAVRYYERSRAAVYRTSTHGRITVRGARDGTYEVTASHVP
jgi:beta-lactamase superfamily II metal-dependent hydrolase